jgi:hypothetical protein
VTAGVLLDSSMIGFSAGRYPAVIVTGVHPPHGHTRQAGVLVASAPVPGASVWLLATIPSGPIDRSHRRLTVLAALVAGLLVAVVVAITQTVVARAARPLEGLIAWATSLSPIRAAADAARLRAKAAGKDRVELAPRLESPSLTGSQLSQRP